MSQHIGEIPNLLGNVIWQGSEKYGFKRFSIPLLARLSWIYGCAEKNLARRLAIIINGTKKTIGRQMIRKERFSQNYLKSGTLSLVHFITEWNGASQITSMIYDDLSIVYDGSANFYTVDIEEEKRLSKAFGIMEVPTILFFRNGELIDHAVGMISKNALIAKIETALSNPGLK